MERCPLKQLERARGSSLALFAINNIRLAHLVDVTGVTDHGDHTHARLGFGWAAQITPSAGWPTSIALARKNLPLSIYTHLAQE